MIFAFYILAILVFAYIIINFILDSKAPKENIKATLIDKKVESFMDANNVMNERYTLIFDINNKTKKFDVSYSNYKNSEVGSIGTLTYKRNKFVSFLND